MKINLNDLAVEITKEEGKKEEVNIAQVKEILSITLDKLAKLPVDAVRQLFEERRRK